MKTRRNFVKRLLGFAGTILAWGGFKNASERCEPKGYTLDVETGLPELTERNLNIMINHQLWLK